MRVPVQSLEHHFNDPRAPKSRSSRATLFWRVMTFAPALLATATLMTLFFSWFSEDGFSPFEGIVIALMGFTFIWIALSVSTALVGVSTLIFRHAKPSAIGPFNGMNVALLVPIYNEVPADVFGNLSAMLSAVQERANAHQFDLFILSDTRDDAIAEQERHAFKALREQFPFASGIYYRRRKANTDRKVGNIDDWVSNWGRAYEAMLVLDADSLMCGDAIIQLSNAMAANPAAGLIQTFPKLFGAETLFGRVQQFSTRVYGAALAAGLTRWTEHEGNYWGHNAIIRTEAFIHCAGLPKVKSRTGKNKLILSHDFIEAGLLRRAGWSVCFIPDISGSYEEVPATLIDYVLRDRRWCQGNLQHLTLVRSKGFHAISRFHLVSGAMGYLASPAWFALLLVWALAGDGQKTSAINYFSGYDPQVSWPSMTSADSTLILMFIYGMLLLPKLIGVAVSGYAGIRIKHMGGAAQFIGSTLFEIFISFLYAPIMMVQQTLAVVRTLLGFRDPWAPQQRSSQAYALPVLIKFHVVETSIGALMLFGMVHGLVSPWLLPIAISLAIAVLLSALSCVNVKTYRWSTRLMATPEDLNAPSIIKHAMRQRRRYAKLLAAFAPTQSNNPPQSPTSTSTHPTGGSPSNSAPKSPSKRPRLVTNARRLSTPG